MNCSNTIDSVKYEITENKKYFMPQLTSLPREFDRTGTVIFSARNVVKEINWDDEVVIIKSFKVPSGLRGLIYGRYRKSKAQRSFENSKELMNRRINTPAPIGFLECYANYKLTNSYYASEKWNADFTLREPLFIANFHKRTEILVSLGQFVWEMHKIGVYHRDFSSGNILIKEVTSGIWSFALVDVNRMEFRKLTLRERMRFFAPLWASDEDLTTIITSYFKASGEDPEVGLKTAIVYSNFYKKRAQLKEVIKSALRLR